MRSNNRAGASAVSALARLTRDNPNQQANLTELSRHIDAKLGELEQIIELRRTKGAAAALAVVMTDRGKAEMDAIRAQFALMQQEEARLRATSPCATTSSSPTTAWSPTPCSPRCSSSPAGTC